MPMLRLGTRGSPLARAQAGMAAAALIEAHGWPANAIETVVITTTGDRVQDRPLAEIGGKALWTKELDAALADGRIDFAVHSMKDVETAMAPHVRLAAMLPRADPRDVLVGAENLDAIPRGATVGTSSPRRAAQLLNRRPDCVVVSLRGNVQTRLGRLGAGEVGATFLAAAGLDRLGIAAGHALPLARWLPAPGQGAVGLACRADDAATTALLAAVDDGATSTAVMAERAFLEVLGGGCRTAVAAHAWTDDAAWRMRAELYAPDGSGMVASAAHASLEGLRVAAQELARDLLRRASPAMRAALA